MAISEIKSCHLLHGFPFSFVRFLFFPCVCVCFLPKLLHHRSIPKSPGVTAIASSCYHRQAAINQQQHSLFLPFFQSSSPEIKCCPVSVSGCCHGELTATATIIIGQGELNLQTAAILHHSRPNWSCFPSSGG